MRRGRGVVRPGPADPWTKDDAGERVRERAPGWRRGGGPATIGGVVDQVPPPPHGDGDALFAALAAEHLGDPEVTVGRMLRAEGLKVHGKVFAFTWAGELMVKVPADRAAEEVAAGGAQPVETAPGRVMREWIAVAAPAGGGDERWRALMDEARAYVAALARPEP